MPTQKTTVPVTHEPQDVERRSPWRDEHLDCICGLANERGGVLEIGRNELGEAVGVTEVLRLIEEIPVKVQLEAKNQTDGGADERRHAANAESAISQKTTRKAPEHDQETARNGHPPASAPLSECILALLRRNPSASRHVIAAALGTTRSKVPYRVDKLGKAGKIERIGPDKGGHWKVLDESAVEPDPTSERDHRSSR